MQGSKNFIGKSSSQSQGTSFQAAAPCNTVKLTAY